MVVLWCEECGHAFESKGLSPRFCSQACRKAAAEKIVTCLQCGKPMWCPPRRGGIPKYCGVECAYKAKLAGNRASGAKWRLAHVKTKLPRRCEWCGEAFETWRPWQRYCSRRCSARACGARARERRLAAEAAAAGWLECPRCHETFEATDEGARPPYCSERCERLAARAREMREETRKAHADNVARHREFLAAEAAAKGTADWEW